MKDQPPINVPRVARVAGKARVAPFAIGLVAIGSAVFAGLASTRSAHEEEAQSLPTVKSPGEITAVPAPLVPQPPVAAPLADLPVTSAPRPAPAAPVTTAAPSYHYRPAADVAAATAAAARAAAAERARAQVAAPALIVDLSGAGSTGPSPGPAASATDGSGGSGGGSARFMPASFSTDQAVPTVTFPPSSAPTTVVPVPVPDSSRSDADRDLNQNERFSNRAGNRETEVAHARRLPNQDMLVVQGTLIAGVMETALDSDLPGYARALVTRDVLSFDGSQVLIPAGSKVIGEYNSGVSNGASRVFIVWNRLIRPDGASIAIASPAVDDLGRGGLGGKVNRHFLQRFGGAILLTVLSGGTNLLVNSLNRSSTVVVSSSEASGLGGATPRGTDIPPTIRTAQGAPVQIFVARDLDFSGVGPATN